MITTRYHAVVRESVTVQKFRFDDEDRFVITALVERENRSDPFVHTSRPLSKTDTIELLRGHGLPESDIQSLIDQAESPSV